MGWGGDFWRFWFFVKIGTWVMAILVATKKVLYRYLTACIASTKTIQLTQNFVTKNLKKFIMIVTPPPLTASFQPVNNNGQNYRDNYR